MFNGDAALGEEHETFHVSRVRPEVPEWAKFDGKPYQGSDYQGYRFCKTNRKPYDTAVVACLIFIANMNKKIMKITSNGSVADWHDGYHLCKAVYPHMNFVIPDLE